MTELKQSLLSVEDLLNMHRTASNETAVSSEIPNIINEEYVTIALAEKKKNPVSLLTLIWGVGVILPPLPPVGFP